MAATTKGLPTEVRLRSYQVGFGDCFLLTLTYPAGARHVLFDFGSTAKPKTSPKDLMLAIANDIASVCKQGKEPLAVVATHRHQDHVSGFERGAKNAGPGEIIRRLKPELVVQPWTEAPGLAEDALGPAVTRGASARTRGLVQRLVHMQLTGALAARETARDARAGDKLADKIHFMGADAIKNRGAVENLMTMGENEYLHFGKKSRLARLLGVKVHVLGPPTLTQTESIRTQRKNDADEFWKVLGLTGDLRGMKIDDAAELASPFGERDRLKSVPPSARWFQRRAKRVRRSQLLQIVRVLDDAMNNTSLILLLQIGSLGLLFPGDAQIENWEYALKSPEHADEVQKLLKNVSLYKVGHHGSRNATPRSLWDLFEKRSIDPNASGRLASVMSSMPGKHSGVPRASLVAALKKETTHVSTERMTKLFRDLVWKRRGARWALQP